jgi:hypothetical protein
LGYTFSWQVSITSFSTYFLFLGHELIQRQNMVIMNLDDLNVWFQGCEQQPPLFQCIMPMAMENLTITWHWYMFCYVIIWGGGCWPWIDRFESPRNYVHLQYMILIHWMWLWDVLFYMCGKCCFAKCCCPKVKMVKHGKTMHNYALCHLDSQIYSFFVVVLVGLGCMLWWQFSRANIMLIWGWSSNGWHMWCFTPLLEEILVKTWFFPKCTK